MLEVVYTSYFRALSIRVDSSILEQLAMMYYGAGRTQDSLYIFNNFDVLNSHNSSEAAVRYVTIRCSRIIYVRTLIPLKTLASCYCILI